MMSKDSAKRPTDLNLFFSQVRAYVFGLTYRLYGRVDDAEDMTQNVMLKAFNEVVEHADFVPTEQWFVQLVLDEMRGNSEWTLKASEEDVGDELIEPILTPESFWKPFQQLGWERKSAQVGLHESFNIGLLTLLQKLDFDERVIVFLQSVLGFSAAETQLLVDIKPDAFQLATKAASDFLEKYYFKPEANRMVWRDEGNPTPQQVEEWVGMINQKDQMKWMGQSGNTAFRCLIAFTGLLTKEKFISEVLEKNPVAKRCHFSLNGQRVIGLGTADETHVVCLPLGSGQGINTLLGYRVEDLSPKIRGQLLIETDEPEI